MKLIWNYLKPFSRWLFLAMGLAAVAQVLELIDPIIFGKIITVLPLTLTAAASRTWSEE
jgi:ATP-binding cassette subfamily B protein